MLSEEKIWRLKKGGEKGGVLEELCPFRKKRS